MFLYRDILSQAWKNTWRHKYLWFFGLFAALLGGWGDLEIVFRGFNGNSQESFYGLERLAGVIFSKDIFSNLSQLSSSQGSYAFFMTIIVLFALFVIGLFLVWLTIVSQSALVHNATRIATGKKHNLKGGLEVGIKKFWPVLGFNLLLKVIIYGLFGFFGFFIISNAASTGFLQASLYPLAAFLVFVPVAIILSFIVKYAICYTVVKGESFLASLKLSWQLFVKNWLVSLEMAFILFFVTFLYALGLMLFFLVLSVPFLFISLIFAKLSFYFNFWLIVVSALILFLFVIILSGSFLAAFQIYSWTSLFLELISRGGASRIVRMFGGDKNT